MVELWRGGGGVRRVVVAHGLIAVVYIPMIISFSDINTPLLLLCKI